MLRRVLFWVNLVLRRMILSGADDALIFSIDRRSARSNLDEKVAASFAERMRSQVILGFMAGLVVILSFAGCSGKSGPAVVLEKEHIAAREVPPSPTAEQSASASAPTPSPSELVSQEEKPRELAEDEIVVDTYVMKKDARGTSRDPRAMRDEQWIVKVEMIEDLRRFNVHTDQTHFNKVKVGDRIKVSYRRGKYTGTVWAAEID